MDWIPVKHRVPNDRRQVLAWGEWAYGLGPVSTPTYRSLLGVTRYNPGDPGTWDCDKVGRLAWTRITHWCEIEGPEENP